MIQLATGNPGGGKSYDVVKNRFIPAYQRGRIIFTNIDGINLDYISYLTGVPESFKENVIFLVDLIPADSIPYPYPDSPFIEEYRRHLDNMEPGAKKDRAMQFLKNRRGMYLSPDGRLVLAVHEFYFYMPKAALAIIDETQNFWSSKDWQSVDISLDYYLSMHRHYGHDCVFITQKPVRVYKEIQRLAEYVWIYEKLSWIGASSRYKAAVMLGVNERRTFKRHVRTYDKKYFPCYKSYTAADVKEQSLDGAAMYSRMKILVVVCVAAFIIHNFMNLRWFNTKDANAKQPKVTAKKNDKPRYYEEAIDITEIKFQQSRKKTEKEKTPAPAQASVPNKKPPVFQWPSKPSEMSFREHPGPLIGQPHIQYAMNEKPTANKNEKPSTVQTGTVTGIAGDGEETLFVIDGIGVLSLQEVQARYGLSHAVVGQVLQ